MRAIMHYAAIVMVKLMIGESALASVGYFLSGDWRKGLYWLCAAGIGVSFL